MPFGSVFAVPRLRPSELASGLKPTTGVPPPAVGWGTPRSARRSRVTRSDNYKQGLRKCLKAPLLFVSSFVLSAPSASVARGRLRASAWLKTPSRVPSALDPRFLAPRGSPRPSLFPRSRSKGGGSRWLPSVAGARVGAFLAPAFFLTPPNGGKGVARLRARGKNNSAFRVFVKPPPRAPAFGGERQEA